MNPNESQSGRRPTLVERLAIRTANGVRNYAVDCYQGGVETFNDSGKWILGTTAGATAVFLASKATILPAAEMTTDFGAIAAGGALGAAAVKAIENRREIGRVVRGGTVYLYERARAAVKGERK